MSGPKRGNPYISPYNKPDNYIFPETPLSENTQPESPLTKTTNDESARDVYDNPTANTGENRAFGTGQVQDKLALGSELDPATFENPIAGGYYQTGPIYCETCNQDVFGAELALPTHLGHQTRYADRQVNEDVDLVHKTGGGYRIDWDQRNALTNPSGMGGDTESYTTKPQLKTEAAEKEAGTSGTAFRGQDQDLRNKPLSSKGNADSLGNANKLGLENVGQSDYSWRAPAIEGDDYKNIKPDDYNVTEDTILLNDDDRTVAM